MKNKKMLDTRKEIRLKITVTFEVVELSDGREFVSRGQMNPIRIGLGELTEE